MTDDITVVRNTKVDIARVKMHDYVFVSRWPDCDPNDPWAVGYIIEVGINYVVVANEDGTIIPEVGIRRWPNVMKITKKVGRMIAAKMPGMEESEFDPQNIADIFVAKKS